jgi:hypothetical protein
MSASSARLTKRQRTACLALVLLLGDISDCFGDETMPLWLRTAKGLKLMERLPFEDLPKHIKQQINLADATIERILARYDLKGDKDYQFLSQVELLKIENLLLLSVKALEQTLLPLQ